LLKHTRAPNEEYTSSQTEETEQQKRNESSFFPSNTTITYAGLEGLKIIDQKSMQSYQLPKLVYFVQEPTEKLQEIFLLLKMRLKLKLSPVKAHKSS
jgi:hypothetical protein